MRGMYLPERKEGWNVEVPWINLEIDPEEQGLFCEEYTLEQCVYTSAASRVYLAKHRKLGEKRIIKYVRRQAAGAVQRNVPMQENEAFILKKLRHPGIPVLYDYRETENLVGLVEEYIEGMPLNEYLKVHSFISEKQLIFFIVKLCRILEYLHSRKPKPVLYQDLKPEHIIIRGDEPVLIDYGIAEFLAEEKRKGEMAGTPGFQAPEAQTGMVDERADLYSLGKVAEILAQKLEGGVSAPMASLIRKALKIDPRHRPESVEAYRLCWEGLKVQCERKKKLYGRLFLPENLKVAVVGSDRGVGTTHLAIALTVWLKRIVNGTQEVYYQCMTDELVLEHILYTRREFAQKGSMIYHGDFRGIRNYGPAVESEIPPGGICVYDCGTFFEKVEDADFYIYVVGSRPWRESRLAVEDCFLERHIQIVVTPASKDVCAVVAAILGKPVFGMGWDADPFAVTKEKDKLFYSIWKREWGCVST